MKKLIPFLLLGVMLIAGCAPGGPSCIPSVPAVNSFSASPPTIAAGETATLSWSVAGATTVSIDQGVGNVALTGNREVTPSMTTVYTLTATNSLGVSVTATAQVIVSGAPYPPTPAGLPVVNSFAASPPSITAGNWANLSWNVSNAASVNIDQGIGSVTPSGNTSVSPIATTTYTLTATNAAGTTTAITQVVVSGAPPATGLPVVNYFTASPPLISAGGSTTLGWSVSNATSVTIDQGVGAVGAVGTTTVAPATSTNYTLTASNAAGWYSLTISVLVAGAPPPVFAVTSVTASVSPPTYAGPCPKTFNFTGVITANNPGTVTYVWERSDGAIVPIQSVTFAAAGSQTVTATWTLSSEGTKWRRLHVLTPNDMMSNQAVFALTCGFAVTGVTASVSPSTYTGPCPKTFNFSGVITANGPGTVTYVWERSDGAIAPIQSVTFAGAGSQIVTATWTLSSEGTKWRRVHVLTPNDMMSNQAVFNLNCIP